MVSILETTVFVIEKIFLTRETIFRVTKKMISGFETMAFFSPTRVPDTKTRVPDTTTMVKATNTMVGDDC
jgi:hypothetical protein